MDIIVIISSLAVYVPQSVDSNHKTSLKLIFKGTSKMRLATRRPQVQCVKEGNAWEGEYGCKVLPNALCARTVKNKVTK